MHTDLSLIGAVSIIGVIFLAEIHYRTRKLIETLERIEARMVLKWPSILEENAMKQTLGFKGGLLIKSEHPSMPKRRAPEHH